MDEMLKLKCECGEDFERPQIYKEWKDKHQNVIWKWKLMYCDKCYKNRVDKALNRLPEIMNALVKDSKNDN